MTYPSPENLTDFPAILQYSNTVTSGVFSLGSLISLFVVFFAFLKLRGAETVDCFVVSSIFISFVGTIYYFLDLVTSVQLTIIVIITVVSFIASYNTK